jgi:hypothetical protein
MRKSTQLLDRTIIQNTEQQLLLTCEKIDEQKAKVCNNSKR